MRGAISKSGGNASLAAGRGWFCGRQGVHREVESEGHEEKYRAVIDGGCPADEPVGQRWGEYYKRAHVRKLFNQLDRWIVRRIWSHRFKRWRNCGWKQLPTDTLFGEYGLVNLVGLIPSLRPRVVESS